MKLKPGWKACGVAQDLAGVRSIKKVFGRGTKFHVKKVRNPPRTVMIRGRRVALRGGTFYHVYRE